MKGNGKMHIDFKGVMISSTGKNKYSVISVAVH